MFIDNISHQNINTKINLLDTHARKQKTESEKFNDKFMDYFKIVLGEISKNQNDAKIDSRKFILNQSGISLNDVMINLEKSSISMQMAIQIRNKITSAYQEIMNQQI